MKKQIKQCPDVRKCAQYDRLAKELDLALRRLAELTKAQRQAFREVDYEKFHSLDRELEEAVGYKERCIGCVRQHVKEHKCKPSGEPLL